MKVCLHMVRRTFWVKLIEQAWAIRSILWLSGVRRVGKTVLSQSLGGVEYFDCELPSARRLMQDPESFLRKLDGHRVVLDEIHRLPNPSQLLKIAADHYPRVRVLATGSSTLGASRKFRDTLTGRKRDLWLTPMCQPDLADAGSIDMERRCARGGMPPFLLPDHFEERDFQEWMDAYWAKDIQELFRLERRDSFQRFTELVLAQSGGIFEATRYAAPCEVSRPTIANYLRVLEATFVAHVIRPFTRRRATEIVSAPKVYGLDSGFVAYYKGWRELRPEDFGVLWEHVVLNEIHAQTQKRRVLYWRSKSGHEIDFVLVAQGGHPIAIECKWAVDSFEPRNLHAFRHQYPEGENLVVAGDVTTPFSRKYGAVMVRYENLASFAEALERFDGRGSSQWGLTSS